MAYHVVCAAARKRRRWGKVERRERKKVERTGRGEIQPAAKSI